MVAEEARCHFLLRQAQCDLAPHAREAVSVRRGAVQGEGVGNRHVVHANHAFDLWGMLWEQVKRKKRHVGEQVLKRCNRRNERTIVEDECGLFETAFTGVV